MPKKRLSKKTLFHDFTSKVSDAVGSRFAALSAIGLILIWALIGPYFNYSDSWQMVISTTTSIVTFLMVFLIQSSQNRDSKAVQIKLDELIRAIDSARNELIDVENSTEHDLQELKDDLSGISNNQKNDFK